MTIKRDDLGTAILNLPFNVGNNEIQGVVGAHKFGRCINIGTSQQTIWTSSIDIGALYPWPTAPFSMGLASLSTSDSYVGSDYGQMVSVNYLGSGYNEFTEVYSLTGQTVVPINRPVLRVNRMQVFGTNPEAKNAGDIFLGGGVFTVGLPTSRYGHILPENNQTLQAFYTVPVGKSARIYDMALGSNTGKEGSVEVYVRNNLIINDLFRVHAHYDVNANIVGMNRTIPFNFSPATDIDIRGLGSASGTDLFAEWCFLLVDSSYYG